MKPRTPEFTRRPARSRAALLTALLLTLLACDRPRPLTEPSVGDDGSTGTPSLSTAYPGGIPIGLFALPTNKLGSMFDGAVRNARIVVETGNLPNELSAIRSRGGKVLLSLAGSPDYYLNSDGTFNFTKWKLRVDMFKSINIGPYITDGTIAGHYIVDEPSDPTNWGGKVIPQSTVEAMAKYSKQIWPGMPTIVRVESTWLAQWSGTYQYLDAAWAQWVTRKGDPYDFIKRNVADAQKKGLALVAGLNVWRGGENRMPMSASLIKSAGSALLSSSYPCAFMSWEYNSTYNSDYLSTTAIQDAMKYLRSKAQNRSFKTCKG
jgi:hypothetical protein